MTIRKHTHSKLLAGIRVIVVTIVLESRGA